MAVNRDHMLGRDIEANNIKGDLDVGQEARALFPESVKVRVLKNNLVRPDFRWLNALKVCRKAMEGSEWEALGPYLKGSNMPRPHLRGFDNAL